MGRRTILVVVWAPGAAVSPRTEVSPNQELIFPLVWERGYGVLSRGKKCKLT